MHHLGRLLPHLLADGVDALGEQPRGVGRLGVGGLGARARRCARGRPAAAKGSGRRRRPGGRGSRSRRRCGTRRRSGRPAPGPRRRRSRGATARTAWVLPLVAPLCHSSWRERLQNQVSPRSRVRSSDSRFIQARVSTRPLVASWTTAGTRPSAPKRTRADQLGGGAPPARPHQALPFSSASSAMTRTAALVPTRAAPAPIIACDGLEGAHAARPPSPPRPRAARRASARRRATVACGARRRCRSWRSRRPTSTTILQARRLTLVVQQRRLDDDLDEHVARGRRWPPRPRTARTTRDQIVAHARSRPPASPGSS